MANEEREAQYRAWIESYVKSVDGFTRGKCGHATAAMQLEFPELRIARGFVHVEWGVDQHFWCIAPGDVIVDPTVSQFGGFGVFEYEELDLTNPADVARVPIGKCMECGKPTFPGGYSREMCDEECAKAFDESL